MSYEVRITFDGMVAIGPPYPLDPQKQVRGPLFAVMPMGVRQQTRASKLEFTHPTYTNVHLPVILTKAKPTAESREVDERRKDGWYVWYPLRERMEVLFDGDSTPGRLDYPPQDPLQPFTDIRDVSDMRRIFPARSTLRDETLSKATPVDPVVAAQVFVPKGVITGKSPAHDVLELRFRPKRTIKEVGIYALQQVVVTAAEVRRFEIEMYSLDSGEDLKGISFDVPVGGIDILIGNADPDDIRAVLGGTYGYFGQTTGDDFSIPVLDFELFYNVLGGFDDQGPLPIPYHKPPFGLRPCYTALANGKYSGG